MKGLKSKDLYHSTWKASHRPIPLCPAPEEWCNSTLVPALWNSTNDSFVAFFFFVFPNSWALTSPGAGW